ncbi:hypothetical protein HSB1_44510 [Halogranum salarium B-1]|uniref:Uncharacterized protein n=1 Tax=Halogranum salarium B-1 TaxID=1210908 RepID=J2Z8V9_9EURY|nr:hypothetical protein HSB1_44510 [Halogranum salarium B-1]
MHSTKDVSATNQRPVTSASSTPRDVRVSFVHQNAYALGLA